MKIQWLAMIILWSTSTKKAVSHDISSAKSSELTVNATHYLGDGTYLDHINPNEQLRRTQRSFLKKIWKNTGLKDLFGDEGCVSCYNNNNYNNDNNAGEEDTFESPLTPSYDHHFQQLPPLTQWQPFHPLRILQPFLSPRDWSFNRPNEGYINNYDGSTTQNCLRDKNSKISEDSSCKYLNEIKGKLDGEYGYRKPLNKATNYAGDNDSDKKENDEKGEDNLIYNENSADKQMKFWNCYKDKKWNQYFISIYEKSADRNKLDKGSIQTNSADESIVYQPTIYVSPQCQFMPPVNRLCSDSQKISEKLTNSEEKYQLTYSVDNNGYRGNEVSVGDLPATVIEKSETLCDSKLISGDIAVYTIVTQIPKEVTSTVVPNTLKSTASSNSYWNSRIPPIILSESDQPYRNCPELFSEYINQINFDQYQTKGNTFVNAQFISC